MATETLVDPETGRKCFFDLPSDLCDGEEITFVLSLHGAGSHGTWQREYFPAHDYVDEFRLAIATPSALSTEPSRHWAADADDTHLENLTELVFERVGRDSIRAFWLAGHSQGGMHCLRLLSTAYFADRVDGWLSLSGGRIGPAPRAENFGPPRSEAERAAMEGWFARQRAAGPPPTPRADLSFIFATGEHEIAALPETSPWAERYGAGPRVRLEDIVDEEPGRIHDARWDDNPTLSWGRRPRPGTAALYVFPGASDGRIIADVVRLDKGHTEGLEPRVTKELLRLIVSAPGGKARSLARPS